MRILILFIVACVSGCQSPAHSWKQQYDCCRPPETDWEIHQVYGEMDLTPIEPNSVYVEFTVYYPSGTPFLSWSHSGGK
jgi:hypothetical protein